LVVIRTFDGIFAPVAGSQPASESHPAKQTLTKAMVGVFMRTQYGVFARLVFVMV
jgi:hypothetical protein